MAEVMITLGVHARWLSGDRVVQAAQYTYSRRYFTVTVVVDVQQAKTRCNRGLSNSILYRLLTEVRRRLQAGSVAGTSGRTEHIDTSRSHLATTVCDVISGHVGLPAS